MPEHIADQARAASDKRGATPVRRRPASPSAASTAELPAPGLPLGPAAVTALQRSAGNAAVSRTVGKHTPGHAHGDTHAHAHGAGHAPGRAAGSGRAAPAVQRAPLGISHAGPSGGARQPLDSEDVDNVRDYVFTSLGKGNHEAVDLLLDRLKGLNPPPDYLDDLRKQVEALRPGDGPEIPSQVHFIWIGGAIPPAALNNILAWAGRATNTGWTINLWTDHNSSLGTMNQARIRTTKGLQRKFIEDAIDPRLAEAYTKATTGKQKAYPFASDIARYSILKKHGGVYADVDLGSGTVNLKENTPKLAEKDVPVLGPLIRDKQSLNATLSQAGAERATGKPTAAQIRAAVTHLLETGGYGNHFIAAQKDSAVMEKMIVKIAAKIKGMDADELHMAGPAASGPFPLLQVVEHHLEEEYGIEGGLNRGEYGRFQGQGRHFHDNMEWLTPESENQNY
ncbi:TcdA/TcdB catalytic glycosyltransferase domain-containing protein [Streptomyces sp. NPDC090052]|uniref:TcdA/TcdB catalytic glycosyltransferase domain-containing protein n=1 Tax=Streptomyces sp. NPDC090052 TaxID=3365931 RepID=UPI0038122813